MRTLLIADNCNPEWPSLPIVTYRYACELSRLSKATIFTHIRNKPNIDKIINHGLDVHFIDNEYIASPIYKLAIALRGGDEVAWSTNMIMNYLPYIEFERQSLKHLKKFFGDEQFDIIHRLEPMSPTMPSFLASHVKIPFILGPLNGNLDWPSEFKQEQKREREGLRALRSMYKYLPFSSSTYRLASAVLAAFDHTINDLDRADPSRIVSFPEIGFEPSVFFPPAKRRSPNADNVRFLFVGRLVPYKAAEAAVRAFADSRLASSSLTIVGDGPERARLEEFARHAQGRVRFVGRLSQAEVGEQMRQADVFVFPSVRELGAGVVIEAMASGLPSIVAAYGAPGKLVSDATGIKIPVDRVEHMATTVANAMVCMLKNPDARIAMGEAAAHEATQHYTWARKAERTVEIYEWVLGRRSEKPAYYPI